MSQDTTAKKVVKLYRQAVAARQRIHTRFPDGDPEAITRVIQKLKIFDSYAQASCRYMCQEILRSLPSELCDMIIEHVIGHNSASIKATGICEPVHNQMDNEPLKHYWKVEYVGKIMLGRMMAVWYRISNFIVHWRYASLRVFLNEEVPCLQLPRYKLITKISISIWPDNFVLEKKKGRQARTAIPSLYLPPTWERLIQDFEYLFQLRSGASIHILIDYPEQVNSLGDNHRDNHRKDLLLKGTAPMLASLIRLRNAGYILGASICLGGPCLRAEHTFEYLLDEDSSLNGDSGNVPADDTGFSEQLAKLDKDAEIYVIIETDHCSKAQVFHHVRRILHKVFPLLKYLHELDLYIHVVVNPAYTTSKAKNNSNVTFPIIHDGPWRQGMTPENDTFIVQGFENRLRQYFEEYGEQWNSRFPPWL